MAAALATFTYKLDLAQGRALYRWCKEQDYDFRELPHTRFAAQKGNVNLVFYESNKLVIQGKGAQEFVEFVLEPLILKEARLGYEAVHDPRLAEPRLGIDESGKGDFFGPLCVAGVYANEAIIKSWQAAGVRDSKNISSDQRIADLAQLIRQSSGCVFTVVPIGNEAYNRLHQKMGSVDRILAWGHARVIENLMLQRHRMKPPPVRAISDQFAAHKSVVGKALMSLGREIELVQRHKAEADPVVAAASILAREEFVGRLARLGKEYGFKFPKGASSAVEDTAKAFIARHGAERLALVGKMHFRTAFRVQGLAEPPRRLWRAKPASKSDRAESA